MPSFSMILLISPVVECYVALLFSIHHTPVMGLQPEMQGETTILFREHSLFVVMVHTGVLAVLLKSVNTPLCMVCVVMLYIVPFSDIV